MAELIQDYLIRSAGRYGDKPALIHRDKEMSYASLLERAELTANWLRQLKQPHHFRGGILTDDPFEYISTYFGILCAGGTVVGLNSQTSERTLVSVVRDCEISVLFVNKKLVPYVERSLSSMPSIRSIAVGGGESPALKASSLAYERLEVLWDGKASGSDKSPREGNRNDIAQIIYTSGTTADPKGVMLRHSNLVTNTESIIGYLDLTSKDRVMAVLPFFYSYGNSVMLTHMAVGGSLVVNQSFLYPNVILDEMVRHQVTGFSGVPSTFAILLHRSSIHDYAFPNLRYLTQAGGPMAPVHVRELKKVLPHVRLYVMYGQTEASARLSYLDPERVEDKAGSIGKAIPGVRLKLLDRDGQPVPVGAVGEIVAEGGNLMAGYWGKPEDTSKVLRKDGLWTGDLARMDDEGYLYIISRKSDMIKSGAHRIAPKEIEDILLEHETVHEAAVVGVRDEILGEAIKACVVLKPGSTTTPKELLFHCKRILPSYKVPHSLEFCEQLPKTSTGKVRKTDLR